MPSAPSEAEEPELTATQKLFNQLIHTEQRFSVDDICCFLCGKAKDECPELELCKHCEQVWYCGSEHLEVHRPGDKCFPFLIKTAPEKGR